MVGFEYVPTNEAITNKHKVELQKLRGQAHAPALLM